MNRFNLIALSLSLVLSVFSLHLLREVDELNTRVDAALGGSAARAVNANRFEDRALPPSAAGSNWSVGSNCATPQVFYVADRPSGTEQIDGAGLDLVGVSGVVPDATGVNIGVQGQVASNATGAGGVLAQSTSASGQTFGLIATAQSPSGAAAFLGSINNADLINSTNNAFNVDGAGNVDANSFAGDGSALTGVTVGDGAITTPKLANFAVTSIKLGDGSVGAVKISPDAVGSVHIADGQVGNSELAIDAVTSSRILDSSVRSQDIANGTILSEDVDGAIYTRKTDLYSVTENTSVIANGVTGLITATCNDSDDLPITFACNGTIGAAVTLNSTILEHWHTEASPASLTCNFLSQHPAEVPISATIYCRAVD